MGEHKESVDYHSIIYWSIIGSGLLRVEVHSAEGQGPKAPITD